MHVLARATVELRLFHKSPGGWVGGGEGRTPGKNDTFCVKNHKQLYVGVTKQRISTGEGWSVNYALIHIFASDVIVPRLTAGRWRDLDVRMRSAGEGK